jgi:hypothetical protein
MTRISTVPVFLAALDQVRRLSLRVSPISEQLSVSSDYRFVVT